MITTRPIIQWPGAMTPHHKRAGKRYSITPNNNRKELLRELEHIGAREAFIQGAYSDDQIRLDGAPRAGARPAHPGIIVTYTTRDGSMYDIAIDKFEDAEQNLRAIVLVMQRLRLIDEAGGSMQGRQYQGFKRLPGGETPPADTYEVPSPQAAAELLATIAGLPADRVRLILSSPSESRGAYRLAAKKAHPDGGGNASAFAAVCRAREILDAHHGQEEQ